MIGDRLATFYRALWRDGVILWKAVSGEKRRDALLYHGSKVWAWIRKRYVLLLIGVAVLAFGDVWWTVLGALRERLLDALEMLATRDPAEDGFRNLIFLLAAGATAIAAFATAPFALLKAWVNERTTDTAEQSLITDRFTRAVGQLGEEKTVKVDSTVPDAHGGERVETGERTEPNLEVRLGAIYALERIAQDSERDHIPIMETLCAYIRQNARTDEPHNVPLGPFPAPLSEDADEAARDRRAAEITAREGNLRDWLASLGEMTPPRDDVRAALKVIGRRPATRKRHEKRAPEPFRIDLARAHLQRANLIGAKLTGATLSLARLEGASLFDAEMEGADLSWARMEGAGLGRARMEGANLRGAGMEGANLGGARMEGAYLGRARMEGADLSWARMEGAILREAKMEGADLSWARMEGADLSEARMEGADLFGARMEGAILREAKMEGAILRGAKMEGADLRGTNLRLASAEPTLLARGLCLLGSAMARADFTDAAGFNPETFEAAFGDASTLLPKDCLPPAHWPTERLHEWAFCARWRGWRESEGLPWPPSVAIGSQLYASPERMFKRLGDIPATPPDTPIAEDEIDPR